VKVKCLPQRLLQILCLVLFAGTFLVYSTTVGRYPVNIADSSELLTAAYGKGLAHPPSYPLYSLFLMFITSIVQPDLVALVANMSSTLFQSTGVVLVFLISHLLLCRFTRLHITAISAFSMSGALTLAFSTFYWDLATYAEVFALNSVFVGFVIYFFFQGYHRTHPWLFGALLGLCDFSSSNHLITISSTSP
jgi:hypothetical protein